MNDISLIFVSIHCEQGPEAVPLGAATVASYVDQNIALKHSVHLMEAIVDEPPSRIFDRLSRLSTSVGGRPVVGFSLYSWNRNLAVAVARMYAQAHPGSLLVAGGPEVTARPIGLDKEAGGPFSVIVQGEGESALFQVLQAWSNGQFPSQSRVLGMTEDLAALPSPWLSGYLDASVIKKDGFAGALWELARGCPYTCTYCYESKGNHRLRYISEERFERELEYFIAKNASSVFVLDPTFNANNKRTLQILDRLIEKATDIHWHFEIRAELLNRDQARRFAQLGASLQIGLQTADPEVSARVGRPLDRSKFKQKIDLLNQEGVVFGLDLMYGLPGDTLKGFMDSLDFAIELYPNHLDIFRLAVLPGTVLADQAAEYLMVYEPEPPYALISSSTFPREDMNAADRLSRSVDFFYNKGRAVAWFNQVLYPLKMGPSRFFQRFADFMDAQRKPWDANLDPQYPASREALILKFLDTLYEQQKIDYLLPAVWDVVRFHGAWARALAEGITTTIDCNYDPDQLFGSGIVDLEEFSALADMHPCRIRVQPGKMEPEVHIYDT
ncbi:B12-binding domain-containing radical SAM protein [Gracilinema caldarium]|uniref:B12-binding domain-containing radical SAM protein n=1 Tax=Gracilinema caldarium TaxID=215591 RepID=UPI0026EDACF0|nr:DUF4080 domain-containing protein [Gracilinema caldarium]